MALINFIYSGFQVPHMLRIQQQQNEQQQRITNQNPNETKLKQTKQNTETSQTLHILLYSLCPVRNLVRAEMSNLT